VRYGYSILLFFAVLVVEPLRAQGVIEGTVQLPKPSSDRGLNQRYAASADIPLAPIPARGISLSGESAEPAKRSPVIE